VERKTLAQSIKQIIHIVWHQLGVLRTNSTVQSCVQNCVLRRVGGYNLFTAYVTNCYDNFVNFC